MTSASDKCPFCDNKSANMTVKVATPTEFGPRETTRILKNIVVISIAFMVHFTAYSGAANLQSSVNAEAGLGTASLAAVYAGLIFSNLVSIPVIIIKWIGTKWTIALSLVTYIPYIAAQLWPSFYTLIPAGILVGLGGGPLWCAKCTYISVASEAHSKISKVSTDALLARFLGLFFMIFQINQVWGNLISSLVISSGDNSAAVTSLNESMIALHCGQNFLPTQDAANLQTQPYDKIVTMSCIYMACMVGAALIISIGVDSMKRYNGERTLTGAGLSGAALLVGMLQLLMEPRALLLVIINIFIGFQQAFFMADFTAAFVACGVGTGAVGLVMMTYGVVDAVGCLLTGCLVKITGRMPLILCAAALHSALFVFTLWWTPRGAAPLYVIAALWGLCDSVWMVQINAFFGILFPGKEEAAFSIFRLWESVGFIILYLISPYFRLSTKTYVTLVMIVVGTIGYVTVEMRQKKKNERSVELEEKKETKKRGCDNKAFREI